MYVVGAAGAAAVMAVLIVVGALTRGDGGGGGPVVVPSPRPTGLAREGRVLGSPDAPVTVIDYADFQCPFCRTVAVSVLSPIEEEFVSTGQVKVQMRPIAILGEESELAAQAAECANEQDWFWEFHDILYANQVREHNSGAFSSENLKRFAEALALDTAAFDSCLDSGKYALKVRDDTNEAGQQGIRKTPTILVNGVEVGSSLDEVRVAIQAGLASGS